MFGFLAKMKEKQLVQTATAHEKYVALITVAATAGDLSKADADRLEKLADELGYGIEQIETDIGAIKRAAELAPIAAAHEQRRVAHKDAGRAVNDHMAETEKIIAERSKKLLFLESNKNLAASRMREAGKAESDLATLRARHHKLFGLAAPMPAARTLLEDQEQLDRITRETAAKSEAPKAAKPAPARQPAEPVGMPVNGPNISPRLAELRAAHAISSV